MKKIILIDDDRDDAELFQEVLYEIDPLIGFEHFEESKEALKILLEKQDHLPDLIFLDINMPLVSGWQCLAEFKKTDHLKKVPVIMFTTSSQPKEKETAKQLGADGFISKPSEYTTLKKLLLSVLSEN